MLNDKVAVITGGTRGIGYATVELFLKNNCKVALFGSKEANAKAALKELSKTYDPDNFLGFCPDLTSIEDVSDTLKYIKEKWGHIDILINNAGVSSNMSFRDYTMDEFDRVMNVNVKGVFVCSKAALPYLEESKGCIINTSSMVSLYGQAAGVAYPASKFAVNGITKSLARELAPMGIRVNAIAPGIIETDMVKALPEEQINPLINSIPLGRIGKPSDIASAMLFLASDDASYITGEILSVDGCARS